MCVCVYVCVCVRVSVCVSTRGMCMRMCVCVCECVYNDKIIIIQEYFKRFISTYNLSAVGQKLIEACQDKS